MNKLLPMIARRLDELIPPGESLRDAARYSLLSPGKRIRPLLVLTAIGMFHIDPLLGLDPACAIEMIHVYSLIHDDLPCMDDDDLRRGRPALHKVFPEGMALLAGDYLLTYAFEVLAKAPHLSPEQRLHLIQILSHAAGSEGMAGGQAIDIASTGKTIDETTLLRMHRGKTAAIFAAALQFGAVIGGASDPIRSMLESLGMEIGLAYQFLDDLLDATSTAKILGKQVRGDAAKGKTTAASLYGIEKVEKKLGQFEQSIKDRFAQLPPGGSSLEALVGQFLWERASCRNCR